MGSKVSIIIPTFNASKYLNTSINSAINQTYTNLEIIIIDDCSTDNSLEILHNFSKKDPRIKIIHSIQNYGVSHSRNLGLNKATGEYVAWLDADDYLPPFFIEALLKVSLKYNCDIVEVQNQTFYNDSETKRLADNPGNLDIEFGDGKDLIHRFGVGKLQTSLWSKLFKRRLFDNFEFPSGEIYEEPYFYFNKYAQINKIAFVNEKLYYYRNTPSSIMKGFSERSIISNLRLQDYLLNHIINKCPYYTEVNSRVTNSLITTLQRAIYQNANSEIIKKINLQIDKTLKSTTDKLNVSNKNRIILMFRKSSIFHFIIKKYNALK